MMETAALLSRIDYRGALTRDEEVLRSLHRAFLTAVPFENLDIHLGRRIVLDETAFLDKIATRRRGGFCYELNGLFAALLRKLGFTVTMLAARVISAPGEPGREFAHLLLRVDLQQPWLADVGFGEWFVEPIRFEPGREQEIDGEQYGVIAVQDRFVIERRPADGDWMPRQSFSLIPRVLGDFAAMCDDFQVNPESFFRQRRLCTRKTHEGRITLSDDRLIETRAGDRRESILKDGSTYGDALRTHFGIELTRDEIARLWGDFCCHQTSSRTA
jgi:N-hydroxyarylamine O-acetyltransferase